MNNQGNNANLTRYVRYLKVLISVLSFFTISIFAEENKYQLNKITQLNHSEVDSSSWQQLITNPSSKQQYFIINATGQMYLIDNMDNSYPVLDIRTNQQTEHFPIKLTAITVHPNFSLRDQLGYNTFYTAHLEALDKKNKVKRIQERSSDFTLKFDAVITEWQFSESNFKKVDLTTKREVIRIAVPDQSMTIKQISFSPYKKAWNDGFGLLYVALNGQEKWRKPLYSGVILRINPAKFGLRNFTIPNNNPFTNDDNIQDGIYLLGGQNIKQFVWPDKNKDDLLLSHYYSNKSLLSLTTGRDDWRDEAPRNILYRSDNTIKDILSYHGRSLPSLRNKLLLLRQDAQYWFIDSLSIKPSINQSELTETNPQQEWQFTEQQLTNNSDISLSTNRDDEVLILDKTSDIVFQIFQENLDTIMPAANNSVPTTVKENSDTNVYFLLIILTIIGGVFFMFKRLQFSAKDVVRKQFAKIKLSESQQQLALYHRHQNRTDTIIDIVDIVSCEVMLNNHIISVINKEAGHGFNDEKELDLRAIFAKEKIAKMVDDKARQINLVFTDNHDKSYTICLYMRKGSDRITKKTYSIVIEDLIDWCWLIAQKINKDETKKRAQKPVLAVDSSKVKKHQDQMPLHDQAAAIRPSKPSTVKTIDHLENNAHKAQPPTEPTTDNTAPVEHHQNSTINTELVNALEKLVSLKQQGFLTQDEFTKAKDKLLESLFNE